MVTRPALEQNEHGREEFKTVIKTHFHPEQLVFADESHFNQLTLRRPYAWFIRGERACRYEFFLRGTKYSNLPTLSLDGILHLEVRVSRMQSPARISSSLFEDHSHT